MKKKGFSLLFIASIVNIMCNDLTESVVKLTEKEDFYLIRLHHDAEYVPFFYKSKTFDIDYSLDLLLRHIKVLEHEIVQKKSWTIKNIKASFGDPIFVPNLMCCFCGGLLALGSVVCMGPVYEGYRQIKIGKFHRVDIPNFMIRMLHFIKFTRAGKQRLDKIDVKSVNYISAWVL